MTELSNGIPFSHNYLSDFNAEFLIRNKFKYQYMTDDWARFKKGYIVIDISKDVITIYAEAGEQKMEMNRHEGVDYTMRQFALVLLDLDILPERITGTTTILEVTNFKLDYQPFQN